MNIDRKLRRFYENELKRLPVSPAPFRRRQNTRLFNFAGYTAMVLILVLSAILLPHRELPAGTAPPVISFPRHSSELLVKRIRPIPERTPVRPSGAAFSIMQRPARYMHNKTYSGGNK